MISTIMKWRDMIEIFRIPCSNFDPFLTHFQGSLRCSMLEIREAQPATVQHSQHFDLNLANSDFKWRCITLTSLKAMLVSQPWLFQPGWAELIWGRGRWSTKVHQCPKLVFLPQVFHLDWNTSRTRYFPVPTFPYFSPPGSLREAHMAMENPWNSNFFHLFTGNSHRL